MNIALVHDWLTGIGGDVRVLKAIHNIYPDAPIYCLTQDGAFVKTFFPNATVHSSFVIRHSSLLLPLFPSAIESFDMSDYGLVISTGSIFSKGLILRPKTIHVNYCHSPTRQVWDYSHAYGHKLFQHFLRLWDRQASTRVDFYITNSNHVRERIKKYYRRDAEVIYPPVAVVQSTKHQAPSTDFFLIISRLYKHKNIDLAIQACNKLGWPLVVIGDGPEYKHLKSLAGPTVRVLGYQSEESCALHFSLCSAFIMPQEEDFGIAPIEAMMYGKPVLALKAGGALEYIQEEVNGLFFDDPAEEVLADGLRRIRVAEFDAGTIKQIAEKFSWQKFQSSFSSTINRIVRSRA